MWSSIVVDTVMSLVESLKMSSAIFIIAWCECKWVCMFFVSVKFHVMWEKCHMARVIFLMLTKLFKLNFISPVSLAQHTFASLSHSITPLSLLHPHITHSRQIHWKCWGVKTWGDASVSGWERAAAEDERELWEWTRMRKFHSYTLSKIFNFLCFFLPSSFKSNRAHKKHDDDINKRKTWGCGWKGSWGKLNDEMLNRGENYLIEFHPSLDEWIRSTPISTFPDMFSPRVVDVTCKNEFMRMKPKKDKRKIQF